MGSPRLYCDVLRRFDAMYPTPAAVHLGAAPVPGHRSVQQQGYFHVELMSVRRSATKLKFLAGSESAMDAFISDVHTGEAVAHGLAGAVVTHVIRYAAPGRINLIGEHTDYNQGFALPIALPDRTGVTFRPDDGDADGRPQRPRGRRGRPSPSHTERQAECTRMGRLRGRA